MRSGTMNSGRMSCETMSSVAVNYTYCPGSLAGCSCPCSSDCSSDCFRGSHHSVRSFCCSSVDFAFGYSCDSDFGCSFWPDSSYCSLDFGDHHDCSADFYSLYQRESEREPKLTFELKNRRIQQIVSVFCQCNQ